MFFDEKIWVNWRLEKDSKGKPTKVPYQINGYRASTTNSKTWETYDKVKKTSDNVGIIFEAGIGVLGVDFDHCVLNGKIVLPEIEAFIKRANTYVEYSPSKTGLHLLFQCDDRFDLITKKKYLTDEIAIEVYNWGRYFTFTGSIHEGSKELRKVNPEEFESLLQTLGYPWKDPVQKTKEIIITNIEPDDDALLRHIFSSKNGKDVESLYNGDISGTSNDASSADFTLCMHFAFWTGKDAERIRRMWLNSPLGQREKTQKRKDYQDRTIENAINTTTDVYTPKNNMPVENMEDEGYIMSNGKNPEPLLILENICRVIDNDKNIKGKFRLNDFTHMTETIWDMNEWVNLYDGCIYEIQRYISSNYVHFKKVNKSMVTDAILSIAYRNKVNPPKDYFKGLVWDQKQRLNSWLFNAYGTPDDNLHQAIGSNWLKGMVKRVMMPGCIFDEVLVLEGKQGLRKSTSLRELGSPWHVETTMSMEGKDFYLLVAGNIIVEFSEGSIFDRSSMKTIKSEVTKTEDQFRPPYERGMMKFKRSCVFAMTSNKLELKDDTGNRRWLPVLVEQVADIDWIKENREQLFAEAYHRAIVLNETTYEYPGEELEELQESRSEQGENDEQLLMWYSALPLEKRDAGVTLSDAIIEIYGKDARNDKYQELTTSSILRRTLKLETKSVRVNGAVVRRWLPTIATNKIISKITTSNENIF
jgi:predicted P-loop ATPase